MPQWNHSFGLEMLEKAHLCPGIMSVRSNSGLNRCRKTEPTGRKCTACNTKFSEILTEWSDLNVPNKSGVIPPSAAGMIERKLID